MIKKIKSIYSKIMKREAFQILQEIQTEEHKQIDDIVNSNLSFDVNE